MEELNQVKIIQINILTISYNYSIKKKSKVNKIKIIILIANKFSNNQKLILQITRKNTPKISKL